MRISVGAKSTTTPTTANEYPSASSFATNIGTCKGDQFVRRKVYVSNRRNKPAIKSAYPTHLLGGIAILDLDSTLNGRVPQDCPAKARKSVGLLSISGRYTEHSAVRTHKRLRQSRQRRSAGMILIARSNREKLTCSRIVDVHRTSALVLEEFHSISFR